MAERRFERGLVDTSVVIAPVLDPELLPPLLAISAVTLAELSAGPVAASDPMEVARRVRRLQAAEASFEVIPFDARCARAYGQVWAAVRAAGRQPRTRLADLQIAATALEHGLPLYTRNAADLVGLDQLIDVIDLAEGLT